MKRAWTTQHSVKHIVAPAESDRLTPAERRYVSAWRMLEGPKTFMLSMSISMARRKVTYVVPQLNYTVSVAGYTPSQ
jgi:hypothetical protein